MNMFKMVCVDCGEEFGDVIYNRCPKCGGLIEVMYDYSNVSREKFFSQKTGLRKYINLLPIKENELSSMGEGNTPLIRALKVGKKVGLKNLFLKNETLNPTGSFVDRGVAILASKIRKVGLDTVSVGFSPNFAISMAAYLTRFNISVKAYLPERVSLGKIYQLVAYGADVYLGGYYTRNSGSKEGFFFDQGNPYYSEGLKTIVFEIFEQLGGSLPDFLVIPMGTGSHLRMIWKGIKELEEIGFIESIHVSLIGVRSKECGSINLSDGGFIGISNSDTYFLDDLCIRDKKLFERAINAIKESGGEIIEVSNKLIFEKAIELARSEGIFPEPAGAAALAGIDIALDNGFIGGKDVVVAIITGSGLKDFGYLRKIIESSKSLKSKLLNSLRAKKSAIGRTKQLILLALDEGEKNIYQIWKHINGRYGLNLRYTTILQHMKDLEKLGLIEKIGVSEGKRKSSIYVITERGKQFLQLLSS